MRSYDSGILDAEQWNLLASLCRAATCCKPHLLELQASELSKLRVQISLLLGAMAAWTLETACNKTGDSWRLLDSWKCFYLFSPLQNSGSPDQPKQASSLLEPQRNESISPSMRNSHGLAFVLHVFFFFLFCLHFKHIQKQTTSMMSYSGQKHVACWTARGNGEAATFTRTMLLCKFLQLPYQPINIPAPSSSDGFCWDFCALVKTSWTMPLQNLPIFQTYENILEIWLPYYLLHRFVKNITHILSASMSIAFPSASLGRQGLERLWRSTHRCELGYLGRWVLRRCPPVAGPSFEELWKSFKSWIHPSMQVLST